MMPILKEIEEQALSLQFKTHNVAKWLGLAVRKLEGINEKCLKELEDLRDLDRELDADEKLQEQEQNIQELGQNPHPLSKKSKTAKFKLSAEQESDGDSKKKEKNNQECMNDFTIQKKVKKDKKLEKKIDKKPKCQKQKPILMICNRCGAKYKKVDKFETHMRLFHGQLDFSYQNQQPCLDELEKAQKNYYIDIVHQSELKKEINQENNLALEQNPQ